MREGQRVQYIGPETREAAPGDEGRILAISGEGASVKWASRAYSTVYLDDLLPVSHTVSVEAALDESLEVGLSTIAARDVYEEEGAQGLLNAMASSGHLSSFDGIAQDVLSDVSARLRQDPSFMAVVSSLEESERDETIRLAAFVLIRDAFDGG